MKRGGREWEREGERENKRGKGARARGYRNEPEAEVPVKLGWGI